MNLSIFVRFSGLVVRSWRMSDLPAKKKIRMKYYVDNSSTDCQTYALRTASYGNHEIHSRLAEGKLMTWHECMSRITADLQNTKLGWQRKATSFVKGYTDTTCEETTIVTMSIVSSTMQVTLIVISETHAGSPPIYFAQNLLQVILSRSTITFFERHS